MFLLLVARVQWRNGILFVGFGYVGWRVARMMQI